MGRGEEDGPIPHFSREAIAKYTVKVDVDPRYKAPPPKKKGFPSKEEKEKEKQEKKDKGEPKKGKPTANGARKKNGKSFTLDDLEVRESSFCDFGKSSNREPRGKHSAPPKKSTQQSVEKRPIKSINNNSAKKNKPTPKSTPAKKPEKKPLPKPPIPSQKKIPPPVKHVPQAEPKNDLYQALIQFKEKKFAPII